MNDENTFKGKSDQTAELIVTKTFISSGYPIKSMQIKLYTGNGFITFFVNENSELTVSSGSEINLPLPKDAIDIAMPILLFCIILPEIRKVYSEESQVFIDSEKKNFKKEIGKEVIQFVAKSNDIDLSVLG